VPPTTDPGAVVPAVVRGDRRALARLITIIEDGRPGADALLSEAFAAGGAAYRIGITGPPGSGKSTLTDALVAVLRGRGLSIGVLAVDPTSPFTGGAILGDRIRMQRHVLDDGVYVRSMASRGHLGGLSAAAPKALTAMDAAGFDVIIVETVGVGQDEVEVTAQADTVVVVVTPGWGDGVQAAKAGVLEIGDVFVVNKADRPGADETASDLEAMLALGGDTPWTPPIIPTVATDAEGVDALWAAIEAHREHMGSDGVAEARRIRRLAELEVGVAEVFRRRAAEVVRDGGHLVAAVEAGEMDPWTAARRLVE
jgi:LAO/AO transport system kinase